MKRALGLILVGTMFAACGGGGGPADVTMVSMANPAQYVTYSILAPPDKTMYAIDVNGDGRPDNALGNIISALMAASSSLKVQEGIDSAVCKGQVLLLLTETSADTTYENDDATGVKAQVGQFSYPSAAPATCAPGTGGPKYDGTDMLTVNSTFTGAEFAGRIMNGSYSSNSPVSTHSPVTVSLQLPLVAGSDPLQLTVYGAHLQFKYSSGKLMTGQVNGVLKYGDVMNNVVPTVAHLLNDRLAANPTGSTEMSIAMVFDVGCPNDPTAMNFDNTPVAKGDGKIALCEVSDNGIIKNVLAPDVQMFAADGVTYAPNKGNTKKDSLSLGIGFSAVKATF